MSAHLEIHEAQDGDCLRLRLTGELDLGSAPVLGSDLMRLRGERQPVQLDLSQLEFMDSTGIHLLIDAFNDARRDGWRFTISPELSPQVDRLFKLTGVERTFLNGGTNGH